MSVVDSPVEDGKQKEIRLFGKNIAEVPCFRGSYLYGITTGIGSGLIYFLFSSRPRMSAHFGFSTFFATTLGYWVYCRHKWEIESKDAQKLKLYVDEYIKRDGMDTIEAVTVSNV